VLGVSISKENEIKTFNLLEFFFATNERFVDNGVCECDVNTVTGGTHHTSREIRTDSRASGAVVRADAGAAVGAQTAAVVAERTTRRSTCF
jgi:hypothetical protein